ncbi:MAG: SCO family protein [Flavisolibacter sp.]|nr:SCO family protein [Flavisolibacter sp.]
MSKKQVFFIVFFSVLVVGFFIAITFLIPEFGKPKIAPIGQVKPFAFTTQDGDLFTEKDMEGKVTAVNFFFTTCKGICPKMSNNLKPVYDRFKSETDFLLISHTCDPQTDSAPVLKNYADSLNVDTKKWVFLTGRKDSLYVAARHSYQLDDPANFVQKIEDDFLHTQFVALVNKKGDVVKIFDGIKPSEMKEMEADIEKLLKQ